MSDFDICGSFFDRFATGTSLRPTEGRRAKTDRASPSLSMGGVLVGLAVMPATELLPPI